MIKFFGWLIGLIVVGVIVVAWAMPKDIYTAEWHDGQCYGYHVREWADGMVKQIKQPSSSPTRTAS